MEARFVEAAKTRQLAEAQAKLQIEKEDRLNAEIEHLQQTEQQHLKRVEEMNTRIPQLEESRRVAERSSTGGTDTTAAKPERVRDRA